MESSLLISFDDVPSILKFRLPLVGRLNEMNCTYTVTQDIKSGTNDFVVCWLCKNNVDVNDRSFMQKLITC